MPMCPKLWRTHYAGPEGRVVESLVDDDDGSLRVMANGGHLELSREDAKVIGWQLFAAATAWDDDEEE